MKTSELFAKAVSEAPDDLKIQIDLSFAISDKLAGILEERGMSQKEFARIVGKTETDKYHNRCNFQKSKESLKSTAVFKIG